MNGFPFGHRYSLTCLLVLLITLIQAQNASISGTVKDKETGVAIEDVIVSIEKTNNHTHTDASGQFSIMQLSAGSYEIDFKKLGYEKQVRTIILRENEWKQLAIELVFNANTLSMIAIESDRPLSAASSGYFSKIDFENRPKNSAQEMLRLVPGLFIAQHAGGGKAEQIFIRGFDCDHGTDVATYVDGVPVNMPSHGHGQGYEDLHFLIPEIVKGISLFKGPYAPQYGDFATAAAVEFNTMDSLENNTFQLETGSVPERSAVTANRGLIMLQLPEKNSRLVSYVAADIIHNRGYFESDQHFNRFNVFSKTHFNLTDKGELSVAVSGFGSSWDASGQIPERAVRSKFISRYGSIDNSEGGITQRTNFNCIYQSQVKGGTFKTQFYTTSYQFKLFSNFTFNLNDSIHGDGIEQADDRIIRGLNTNYTIPHRFGKLTNNKFTFGASFRSDEITNELWHAEKRARLEVLAKSIIHQRSTSMYVNEQLRFGDHFRIEAGARYDYFIFDVADQVPTDSVHTNYSGYNYQTLLSPKLNIIYAPSNHFQLFLNTGSGYHSNDARSSVQEKKNHQLPRSLGAEVGSLLHIGNNFAFSAACWWLDTENELVYVGDDGTTENKGAGRRTGIDLTIRYQINAWLFADVDFNFSKSRFIDTIFGNQLTTAFYIPLAPTITSTAGMTAKSKKGWEGSIRYRYMAERPANESNTIIATGYMVVDASCNYKFKHYKIGLVLENMLNAEWNEAQFATESKLPFETKAVDELHFTPGTPFGTKIILSYTF